MEWFIAVVIVAALGVAAVAAAGGLGGMAKEPVRDVYRQDLPDDRRLAAADINGLRFGTALRGYAMDQVDDILDRLSREIAERDDLIARLRGDQPAVDHPLDDTVGRAGEHAVEPPVDLPTSGTATGAGWERASSGDPEPSAEIDPALRSDEVATDYR